MLLGKGSISEQWEYVALIINYFKKMRVCGGLNRSYMGILI